MTWTPRGLFAAPLLAFVTFVAPADRAEAQVVIISGTVKSTQGQRLQSASVRIQDLNVAVATDSAGFYRISVPLDRNRGQSVLLTVRAIGYRPQSKQVMVATQTHDFVLETDVNRVSEVVVANNRIDTVRTTTGKQLAFTVDKGGNVYTATGSANFSQHLYPPELIMQNQGRLRITDSQREAILQEIYKVQATAANVQWRVSQESEKLNAMLERDSVSEAQVLEQAKQMIMYETAVKQAQLSMLIRIRNLLTQDQREMLRTMRRD